MQPLAGRLDVGLFEGPQRERARQASGVGQGGREEPDTLGRRELMVAGDAWKMAGQLHILARVSQTDWGREL